MNSTTFNRRAVLAYEVRRAMDRAGSAPGALLIPTFAVERAQELIADLTQLMEEQEGVAPARAYLGRQLKDRPSVRGESALIDLTLAEGAIILSGALVRTGAIEALLGLVTRGAQERPRLTADLSWQLPQSFPKPN